MTQSKEQAISRAKADLSKRLGTAENKVTEVSTENIDFPDMSLGAPRPDEMSGQMISSGWKINLQVAGNNYEYRADANQLRLFQFESKNYLI